MQTLPFMQVDAFATEALCGNPCAIVLEADNLDTHTMQAIAHEQNLSETAFVLRSAVADVRARYFTPLAEIPLAGHPTIATMHALAETGRIQVQAPHSIVTLELPAGVIPIEIYSSSGGCPKRVVMTQLKPRFLAEVPAEHINPVFGIAPGDLHPDVPVQVVSTGTPQLMICVREKRTLRKLNIRYRQLAQLCRRAEFFSAHLFCVQEGGKSTFARHFAPEFEDPFTGSATGSMGTFLWHYGLIPQGYFIARQGDWMGRPGVASVEVIGPPDDIAGVKVGGGAVTVIRGTITL